LFVVSRCRDRARCFQQRFDPRTKLQTLNPKPQRARCFATTIRSKNSRGAATSHTTWSPPPPHTHPPSPTPTPSLSRSVDQFDRPCQSLPRVSTRLHTPPLHSSSFLHSGAHPPPPRGGTHPLFIPPTPPDRFPLPPCVTLVNVPSPTTTLSAPLSVPHLSCPSCPCRCLPSTRHPRRVGPSARPHAEVFVGYDFYCPFADGNLSSRASGVAALPFEKGALIRRRSLYAMRTRMRARIRGQRK
jgi:hypothetical protein